MLGQFKEEEAVLNLLVLDDCVAELTSISADDRKVWLDVLNNGRHLLGDKEEGRILTTWLSTQYLRLVPKAFRVPLQGFVLLRYWTR